MTQTQAPAIHHYTSVQSLAYILSSGTLRFSRIDQFDDVQEAQTVAGWSFGEMLFASCWVAEALEDYPQWEMYGDSMRGVRLSLPQDPFNWYPYQQAGAYVDNVHTPIEPDRLCGVDYMVGPDLRMGAEFLRRVEYVDDINQHWRENCHEEAGSMIVKDSPQHLASYKSKGWEFQKERRFVLQILGREGPSSNMQKGSMLTHFDVALSPHALDHLVVRMGPLSSGADRIIVESLLRAFVPKARLEDSHLTGLVRRRFR